MSYNLEAAYALELLHAFAPEREAEWECPHCGVTWALEDGQWFTTGVENHSESSEHPSYNGKCLHCLVRDMTDEQVVGFAEEYGERAKVLCSMFANNGRPLDEEDVVVSWSWKTLKADDIGILAEATRGALWWMKDEMLQYMMEVS